MLQIPDNCTGCYSCYNGCPKNCISMEDNGEGFLYPYINLNYCVNCKKCEKVCPVNNPPSLNTNTIFYAAKNKNISERYHSTSGGIFPILAKYVLSQGGIVAGAAYDDHFVVRHIFIESTEQIHLLQGAKYSQSRIGDSFAEIRKLLQSGRIVLFSGTPCQCSGLMNYLGENYKNLIMADLICHGVPSPKVWQAYIDYRSNKENNGIRPKEINMRSKTSGWSRYGYSTEFDYGNGHITRAHNSQDLFMKIFVGNLCLRDSCSNCVAKGIERCSDFTLGDYWGVWNQHPEIDDDKGVSIVFVHTKKGKKIFETLRAQMEYIEVDVDSAYKENPSLVASSKAHDKRAEFFKRVNKDIFEELVDEYFPLRKTKKSEVFQRLKGKLKRLFFRR